MGGTNYSMIAQINRHSAGTTLTNLHVHEVVSTDWLFQAGWPNLFSGNIGLSVQPKLCWKNMDSLRLPNKAQSRFGDWFQYHYCQFLTTIIATTLGCSNSKFLLYSHASVACLHATNMGCCMAGYSWATFSPAVIKLLTELCRLWDTSSTSGGIWPPLCTGDGWSKRRLTKHDICKKCKTYI